jgi:hypothetical protein
MAVIVIHDGIESYITEECAVSVEDLKTMTDAEIAGYFCEKSFVEMWGAEAMEDLPYEFEEMAAAAQDMRERANGDEDETPRRRYSAGIGYV